MQRRIDKATLRELAVKASADPRSIQKALRGQPVRGLAGHRVLAALKAAGICVPELREEEA
jgi:hypothetical protein